MGWTIDPAIRVGDLVSVAGFIVGGIVFLFNIRSRMDKLTIQLASDNKIFIEKLEIHGRKLENIETVLSQVAVQEKRLDFHEKLIDEMRHQRS